MVLIQIHPHQSCCWIITTKRNISRLWRKLHKFILIKTSNGAKRNNKKDEETMEQRVG